MATTSNTISAFSIYRATSLPSSSCRSCLPVHFLRFRNATRLPTSFSLNINSSIFRKRLLRTSKNLRCTLATAESETLASEGDETSSPPADETVSVTVSPSDVLTMIFQAEGTMNELAIPTVTQALEETEGITDLRVQVVEGIASVELIKQTTIQATGVASNLVEIIQSKGFKLQTLNLSFKDEDDIS